MRIMAIDYGDARTGYAISDASGLLAGETGVLPSRNEDKLLEDLRPGIFAPGGTSGLIFLSAPQCSAVLLNGFIPVHGLHLLSVGTALL